ncbi:MAG: 3-oxoacyl-ACP reductase family protein [Planctomycetota bacterium]|nr:3-oxoacyl-ACP reductase family protein [Planctomycetota bacterium]
MHTIDLNGKVSLVTGSSQGIGESIARTLHAAGSQVVINYFDDPDGRNRGRAEAIVAELGERTLAVGGDVRSSQQMEGAIEQAMEQFGGLDVLVNNAGILRDRTLKKMSETEWQDVIDTNLTGVFHTCKAAVEKINEGGRVINIASLAAATGFFGQANYVAAKSGVIGLTKVLSKELARRNIMVNAVAPGVIQTEMGESIPEENRKWMLSQVPLGRFGEPGEVASVVLFLASDLASYVSGQTIHVNGGWWG